MYKKTVVLVAIGLLILLVGLGIGIIIAQKNVTVIIDADKNVPGNLGAFINKARVIKADDNHLILADDTARIEITILKNGRVLIGFKGGGNAGQKRK